MWTKASAILSRKRWPNAWSSPTILSSASISLCPLAWTTCTKPRTWLTEAGPSAFTSSTSPARSPTEAGSAPSTIIPKRLAPGWKRNLDHRTLAVVTRMPKTDPCTVAYTRTNRILRREAAVPHKIGLGQHLKTCYAWAAFVALVTPLDSIEGAASSHLRPLLLYGWRRSRTTNSLKRRKYISERTRNSKVVQCQQGFWIHPAPVRRGRFRPLFRDSGGRL